MLIQPLLYPHHGLTAPEADARIGKARWELDENETSSVQDEVFPLFRDPGPGQVRILDPLYRLDATRDVICMHFEKRISHLFALAALCYRTGYVFREGHTVHQGLASHHIQVPVRTGGTDTVEFAAAHHATLPCLYARAPDSPNEFVFAYRSDIYDEGNATASVPKEINSADTAIDGTEHHNKLRDLTVALLNQASTGHLSPIEVTAEFSRRLVTETGRAIAHYEGELQRLTQKIRRSPKEEKWCINAPNTLRVLRIFQEHAHSLITIADNPVVIDRWLNLRLDAALKNWATAIVQRIREGAEVLRTDVLHLIKRKIDDLTVEMRYAEEGGIYRDRAPNHFEELYHDVLFRYFPAVDYRRIIEEAIGTTQAALTARVLRFQRIGKTSLMLQRNADKIARLVNELNPLIAKIIGQPVAPEAVTGLSDIKAIGLRPGVYASRYHMIQAEQQAKSAIKSTFDRALKDFAQISKARHIKPVFYQTVLKRVVELTGDPSYRLVMSKLLAQPAISLDQTVRECKVNERKHQFIRERARYINAISNRIDAFAKQDVVAQRDKDRVVNDLRHYFLPEWDRDPVLRSLIVRRLYDVAEGVVANRLLDEIFQTNVQGLDLYLLRYMRTLSAETLMTQQADRITEVAQVVHYAVTNLRAQSQAFRGKLLRELRKSHGYKQSRVVNTFRQYFPRLAMCNGTMSELETGRKVMNYEMAAGLAHIFDVHPALFYTQHFADLSVS